MEKIKLPLKITEAIRTLQLKWENKAVLQLKNYEFPTHEEAIVIKEYFKLPDSDGFERLVTALYVGYELEETTEDKVRELYDYFGQAVPYSGIDIQNKIEIILTTLGFKIDGIN